MKITKRLRAFLTTRRHVAIRRTIDVNASAVHIDLIVKALGVSVSLHLTLVKGAKWQQVKPLSARSSENSTT